MANFYQIILILTRAPRRLNFKWHLTWVSRFSRFNQALRTWFPMDHAETLHSYVFDTAESEHDDKNWFWLMTAVKKSVNKKSFFEYSTFQCFFLYLNTNQVKFRGKKIICGFFAKWQLSIALSIIFYFKIFMFFAYFLHCNVFLGSLILIMR